MRKNAEDNKGDDDTYGDSNDNANVAPRCPCGYVTFKTPPIQKHSCFLGFSDKNFATSRVTSPSNQQKEDEQHGICDTFAKTSPKSKNKLLWNKISETSSC